MDVTPVPVPDAPEMRTVSVLGSTGSIGRNTIDLIERHRDRYRVEALTSNGSAERLADQARRLDARLAVVADGNAYGCLKDALWGTGIEVAAGAEALVAAADRPADLVVAGIVGAAGLAPTMAAVRRGAVIALANKECLVCAGELMVAEVTRHGGRILPVDSEHSAIFQVFEFENADQVRAIILTASGGPFRTFQRSEMASVSPAQAVAHPNWSMGAKISVDSATMMNKGLELIEAFHLFPVSAEQVEVLVHPQSVVHSLVEYVDGSVLAQLGTPDMRTPIAFALSWPNRIAAPAPRLRLAEVSTLTFEEPDETRFPALRVARHALQSGGSAPTIMNAANEVAVASFLAGEIGFLDIVDVVEECVGSISPRPLHNLDQVSEIDAVARELALRRVSHRSAQPVG